MNREESIALVNGLCSEYRAIEGLQKEIDGNETLIREHIDAKPARKGLFGFFRRYLVYGGIAFAVLFVPITILAILVFTISFESNLNSLFPHIIIIVLLFILIAVPSGILIFGYRKASRKREELFLQDVDKAAYNKKRMDELESRTGELRMQMEAKLESLHKYDDLIPEGLREREAIEKMKRLLVTGKAETISDAIERLKAD